MSAATTRHDRTARVLALARFMLIEAPPGATSFAELLEQIDRKWPSLSFREFSTGMAIAHTIRRRRLHS